MRKGKNKFSRVIPAAAVIAAVQATIVGQARAAVPLADSFNYPAGGLSTVAPGIWNIGNTGGTNVDIQVNATSLNYVSPFTGQPALPTTGGGSVTIDATSAKIDRTSVGLIPPAGTTQPFTLYYSLTIDPTDLTGIAATGGFVAGFNNTTATSATSISQAGARLTVRQAGGTDNSHFNLGIRNDVSATNATAAAAFDTTSFSTGTTIFVVAAYTFNTGSTVDDVASLWVNPNPNTFGSQIAPTTTIMSTGGDINQGQIESFFLRQIGNSAAGKTLKIDDIRIDTSWSGVAPLQWNTSSSTPWSTSASWSTNTIPDGVGIVPTFGNGTGVVITLDSSRTVGGLSFNGTSGTTATAFTIGSAAGATLTIQPASGFTGAINTNAGTQVIASPLNLASDTTVFVSSTASSLTISGPLSGAGALTKTGSSPLFLTGNNTGYSGTINATAGFLRINSDAALGAVPTTPTVNLNLSGGLLFDGNFTVNANRSMVLSASPKFSTNGNNATWAGAVSGTGSIEKVSSGTLALTGNLSYSGNTTVTNGTLALGSSLTTSPSFVISAGASAALTQNGSHVLSTGALAIDATGQLDVGDNDVIVNYSGSSPIATISGYLKTGFNAGAWNGKGIGSALAGTNSRGLGYGEASDVGITTLDGVNIAGPAVIVKYTYYGDSDLDGSVTTGDFSRFLDGFATGGSTWGQGDYTYDGKVDLGNDFNLFLVGYLGQGGSLGDLAPILAADTLLTTAQKASLVAVIPEPSSAAMLAIGAAGLAARRRRRSVTTEQAM